MRSGSRDIRLAIITTIIFCVVFVSILFYYLVCFRCLYDKIKMYIISYFFVKFFPALLQYGFAGQIIICFACARVAVCRNFSAGKSTCGVLRRADGQRGTYQGPDADAGHF